MRKGPLHFVIPDPEAFPSGGNIYNQGLLKGLQSLAVPVKISTQIETDIIVDPKELLLVDTLFMEAFAPIAVEADCLLIVHHLEAMEQETLMASTKEKLKKYQGFLSTSTFTTNFLKELGLTQPVITLVPALSLPIVQQRSIAHGSSQKVLIVANLIERKGILPFLQEWSQYPWPDDFRLEIIGSTELDPDYAAACFDFWRKLSQQQQIHFTGSLPQQEVFQKYQEADLLLSPAKMETFGMAIQEAIACGLPVLLLQGGYAASHLQAENHGQSFSQLKQLVAHLNTWSQSPQLQTKYQQAAQKVATTPNTSWPSAARTFLSELQTHFPD